MFIAVNYKLTLKKKKKNIETPCTHSFYKARCPPVFIGKKVIFISKDDLDIVLCTTLWQV